MRGNSQAKGNLYMSIPFPGRLLFLYKKFTVRYKKRGNGALNRVTGSIALIYYLDKRSSLFVHANVNDFPKVIHSSVNIRISFAYTFLISE